MVGQVHQPALPPRGPLGAGDDHLRHRSGAQPTIAVPPDYQPRPADGRLRELQRRLDAQARRPDPPDPSTAHPRRGDAARRGGGAYARHLGDENSARLRVRAAGGRSGSPAAATEDRKWLSEHSRPLPNSGVWIGRYVGTIGAIVVARSTLFLYNLDDPSSIAEPSGLVTTLVYGQLALRVALVRSQPTYTTSFAVNEIPGTSRIWPRSGLVRFPSGETLDDTGLAGFIEMQVPLTGPGALDRLERPPGRDDGR